MNNGKAVEAFERMFSEYVGAAYAVALCNGTATLHTALEVMRREVWDAPFPVTTTPLTMSATTLAILHAGMMPQYVDIDRDTWLASTSFGDSIDSPITGYGVTMGVSLYGLHGERGWLIDDAAQTLRQHGPWSFFTSYSFQASKILGLGEGGMLVTNDRTLARAARQFSSLGYAMDAKQPRIDPATLKGSTYARHHSIGYNYRMSDHVATVGCERMGYADQLRTQRVAAAAMYREAHRDCRWISAQHVPDGFAHDYWAYAVALNDPELVEPFADSVVRHGGERPYGAWRLSYHEPALAHLAPRPGTCPVAEDLQPRLLQFQTNRTRQAAVNANAMAAAISELG